MPRRQRSNHTLPGLVRAHFGLTQAELAYFMGVSRGMVAHLEAGRKELSLRALLRLTVLSRLLPPPEGSGAPAPVFLPPEVPTTYDDPDQALPAELPGTVDTPAVRMRLRELRALVQITRLTLGLRREPVQQYARRRWAVGVLSEALTAPVGETVEYPGIGRVEQVPGHVSLRDPLVESRFLERLAQDTEWAPVPLDKAERALRVARLRGLEAELAALEAALAG